MATWPQSKEQGPTLRVVISPVQKPKNWPQATIPEIHGPLSWQGTPHWTAECSVEPVRTQSARPDKSHLRRFSTFWPNRVLEHPKLLIRNLRKPKKYGIHEFPIDSVVNLPFSRKSEIIFSKSKLGRLPGFLVGRF